jgi:hypothetical protein
MQVMVGVNVRADHLFDAHIIDKLLNGNKSIFFSDEIVISAGVLTGLELCHRVVDICGFDELASYKCP